MKRAIIFTTAALFAAPVFAETYATVATDLNLRDGAGSEYEIITVIPAGAEVIVEGCLEDYDWCEVAYDNMSGWAYAPYLDVSADDEVVAEDLVDDEVVAEDILDAAVDDVDETPEEAIIAYIEENPVEPVYLEEELIIGATIPEAFELYDMPESDGLYYLNINGMSVLVDAARQIVNILR